MSKANTELLEMLHGLTARELIEQIRDGVPVYDSEGTKTGTERCPAAVLNVARAFLKDNHIEDVVDPRDAAGTGSALAELASLPFTGDDGGTGRH